VRDGEYVTEEETVGPINGTPAQYAPKEKEWAGTNVILPNGKVVISYDSGKTYEDEQGNVKKVPTVGSVILKGDTNLEQIQGTKAREQAGEELGKASTTTVPKQGSDISGAKTKAAAGTGPYSFAKRMFDKVIGGLGGDVLVGREGFFSDATEGQQYLNTVRQIGKSALLNSARGAIWEQERIDELFPNPDTFFTNPRTEAKKLSQLEKILEQEKEFNLKNIQTAINTKEIEKLRQSNNEIDRLLNLLRDGPNDRGQSSERPATLEDIKSKWGLK